MTDDGLKLPQRRAMEALAAGQDKAAAAAAAGVSVRSIQRYMADPRFRAALTAATGERVGNVSRQLVAAMETAVSTMLAIVESDAPPTVRLRAAAEILSAGIKLYEQAELTRRIEALEERYNEH
jgi:hypothetical protein